jgi:hypothetical protein
MGGYRWEDTDGRIQTGGYRREDTDGRIQTGGYRREDTDGRIALLNLAGLISIWVLKV